jgi:membrane protease YdiL (CAAX protease family)
MILLVINMLVFLVPSIVTAFLLNLKPFLLLGFTGRISVKQTALVAFITGAAIFVGGALSYVNQQLPISPEWKLKFDELENSYRQQANAILTLKDRGDYILALVVMGFIPAFCEETLFRGGLQNFLTRATRNPWLAIIIVSVIFSVAHFSFYGFLFRFFLGATLGLIYYYSGKLWLSILAHFLNNAFVITVYYAYIRQGKSVDQAMNEPDASYWGILALPVLVVLFSLLKRESSQPGLKY